jgi:para-nitrobenzyl esterase
MTAAGQSAAWIYRFDYVTDSLRSQMPSAPHASKVAYLFDQLDLRYGEAVTSRDRALAKTFHEYFVNFAKHGDPNGGGHGDGATQHPAWRKFDSSTVDLMMFTGDGEAKIQADPWQERLRLVERALERRGLEGR